MAAVAAALQARGLTIVLAREPGGTPLGDAVRELFLRTDLHPEPLAELLLINASRTHLVTEVIRPALAAGHVVLCDRYVHSSYAYQGFGRGVPPGIVRSVCDAATGSLMPEIVFYVDVTPELSRERVHARNAGHDRMELQDAAFFERVRNGYLQLAREDERIAVIDGSLPAADVVSAALARLEIPTP